MSLVEFLTRRPILIRFSAPDWIMGVADRASLCSTLAMRTISSAIVALSGAIPIGLAVNAPVH